MRYLGLFLGLLVAGLILTCAVKNAMEYCDGPGKRQVTVQDQQFKAALDMLKEYPTAAGGKK